LATSRRDNEIAWHENTAGDGSAWIAHLISKNEMDLPLAAFVADVDGDGDMDALATSLTDNKICWFENGGDGSLWTTRMVADDSLGAHDVFPADLDGDGDLDLLGAAFEVGEIYWYENRSGDGGDWSPHLIDDQSAGVSELFAADFDGDGDLDTASISWRSREVAWYPNLLNEPTDSVDGGLYQASVSRSSAVGPTADSSRLSPNAVDVSLGSDVQTSGGSLSLAATDIDLLMLYIANESEKENLLRHGSGMLNGGNYFNLAFHLQQGSDCRLAAIDSLYARSRSF